MQRAIVFALLFGFPSGAYGTECAAGYKHKASLTSFTCATHMANAASCNSDCCEKDKTKCGGLDDISCPWDQYAAGGVVWKNTPATEKTKNTACCQPKVSCANTGIQAVMPAGKMLKPSSDVATTKCSSDAKSCTRGDTCLKDDVSTCGGKATKDGTKCGTGLAPKGTDDTWKNTKTLGAFDTNCCAAELKCKTSTFTCAEAGRSNAKADILCKPKTAPLGGKATATAIASDCGLKVSDNGACCTEKDPKKCGGPTTPCTDAALVASDDSDAWKNRPTTPATRDTDCCVKKATCASAVCTYDASGKRTKNKPNVETTPCTGNAKSCDSATCCEVDTSKCGGFSLAEVSCAYGTIDERITWNDKTPKSTKDAWNNKPGNSTNKDTNCCTPVAVCALPVGTTTPAATATPAAPALKFSQHMATIEESSGRPWGVNMVWLGVGGLIGMSVLMLVQRLRSRMQMVVQADAGEVGVLLEDSSLD